MEAGRRKSSGPVPVKLVFGFFKTGQFELSNGIDKYNGDELEETIVVILVYDDLFFISIICKMNTVESLA